MFRNLKPAVSRRDTAELLEGFYCETSLQERVGVNEGSDLGGKERQRKSDWK